MKYLSQVLKKLAKKYYLSTKKHNNIIIYIKDLIGIL